MKFIIALLAVLLSGCAAWNHPATGGAMAGIMGGPLLVDEIRHNEFKEGSLESGVKGAGHMVAFVLLFATNPVGCGVYMGGSALYGVYYGFKEARKPNNGPMVLSPIERAEAENRVMLREHNVR